MRVTAKLVVLDVLAATARADVLVPVRRLVHAAAAFHIAERSVRVALARLSVDKLVVSPRRGHYRLGPAALAVNKQVSTWRDVSERMRPWDGAWIGVQSGGVARGDRPAQRKRKRAERLLGLRELQPHLAVRPDNLTGDIGGFRARLNELSGDCGALVFRMTDLDADVEARAVGLWNADELIAEYRHTVTELERSTARLRSMPLPAAVRESFLLGRNAIRTIVLDPLLPEPLVPGAERRILVDAMRAYDRLGLSLWFEYLDVGHDAERRALAFTETASALST